MSSNFGFSCYLKLSSVSPKHHHEMASFSLFTVTLLQLPSHEDSVCEKQVEEAAGSALVEASVSSKAEGECGLPQTESKDVLDDIKTACVVEKDATIVSESASISNSCIGSSLKAVDSSQSIVSLSLKKVAGNRDLDVADILDTQDYVSPYSLKTVGFCLLPLKSIGISFNV